MPEEEFQEHNDYHYQYYVSFVELNRRWDTYIHRENIEVVLLCLEPKIILEH